MSKQKIPTPVALVFPGQGSQAVGMGKALLEAYPAHVEPVFSLFDKIIPSNEAGQTLSTLMQEGPENELKRTLYTQPAIAAVSVAALHILLDKLPKSFTPCVTAGHSLGELPALYAAGVIPLETLVYLISERASAMEGAAPGAMSAVLGLTRTDVEQVINELRPQLPAGITVVVANDNAPQQVVISGSAEGVQQAGEALKAAGAKRVIALPVGGAFHSPLMFDAGERFGAILKDTTFVNASCPVISNVTAEASQDAESLRNNLARQITGAVYWTDTMNAIAQQFQPRLVLEVGPGSVLSGLFKKAQPTLELASVSDPDSLRQAVERIEALLPSTVS